MCVFNTNNNTNNYDFKKWSILVDNVEMLGQIRYKQSCMCLICQCYFFLFRLFSVS